MTPSAPLDASHTHSPASGMDEHFAAQPAPSEAPPRPSSGPVQGKVGSLTRIIKKTAFNGLLVVVAFIGASIPPAVNEHYANKEGHERIEQMKQEQARLIGLHLASPRHIGVVRDTDRPNNLGNEDKMVERISFAGYNVGDLAIWVDDHARSALGKGFLTRENAISPKTQSLGKDSQGAHGAYVAAGALEDTAWVYRHEEGHAQMVEEFIHLKAPSTWNSSLQTALVDRLNTQRNLLKPVELTKVQHKLGSYQDPHRDDFETHRAFSGQGHHAHSSPTPTGIDAHQHAANTTYNWRDNWMAEIRGEAFADAFSILTQASAGAQAMKEIALKTHAFRMVGTQVEKNTSAMDMAGNGHSVDMASFIAGQMKASDVSKLSRTELLELSGRIADASLAWSIARQGEAIGFFSSEGETWAVTAAKARGLDPKSAQDQWKAWKNEATANQPQAAFGTFDWDVGGHHFKAKGLMKHNLQDIQWRFDGKGGVMGARYLERGKNGPVAQQKIIDLEDSSVDMFEMAGLLDAKSEKIEHAKNAPLWTQWVMAKRLGTQPLAELKRFETSLGSDAGESNSNYSMTQLQSIDRKMNANAIKAAKANSTSTAQNAQASTTSSLADTQQSIQVEPLSLKSRLYSQRDAKHIAQVSSSMALSHSEELHAQPEMNRPKKSSL